MTLRAIAVVATYAELTAALRAPRMVWSPPRRFCTAAVAITVRGHNALTAMPSPFSSSDMPSTHIDMPITAEKVWRFLQGDRPRPVS